MNLKDVVKLLQALYFFDEGQYWPIYRHTVSVETALFDKSELDTFLELINIDLDNFPHKKDEVSICF